MENCSDLLFPMNTMAGCFTRSKWQNITKDPSVAALGALSTLLLRENSAGRDGAWAGMDFSLDFQIFRFLHKTSCSLQNPTMQNSLWFFGTQLGNNKAKIQAKWISLIKEVICFIEIVSTPFFLEVCFLIWLFFRLPATKSSQ